MLDKTVEEKVSIILHRMAFEMEAVRDSGVVTSEESDIIDKAVKLANDWDKNAI